MKWVASRILALLALIGTLMIASTAQAQSKEPLVFGVSMPLTGSQAAFGLDFVTGVRWAVADINAKGGVEGRPLEMVVVDTQADPQLGIAAVNRLISVNKVPVFISAWSGIVKVQAPVANREKVLELSVGASSPEVAKLGDYVYTLTPLADVDVNAIARYTFEKLGKRRVAVMYINNESGIGGARIFKQVFEKAGGQIVAYEAYDPKATDMSGPVLKVKATNPDFVYIHGLIADIPMVIAQMRQLGMTTRVGTYGAGYNPKVIDALGAGAEGLVVTSMAPGPKDSPAVAAFVDRWLKTEKRVSNALPYTQYTYDSAYVIAELFRKVIKSGQPITGENLRNALVATKKFEGPMTGHMEIRDDHSISKPIYLLTVDKGQFVPLAVIH